MTIITVISIFLIMSFLVVVHELGHFWASRKNGVRVEEFGIGYPPKIFGKKFGETLYSINLIPFGGFVRITGEGAENEEEEKQYLKDSGSFVSKTVWQKIVILSAGVFMNLILAISFFYLFFFLNNFRTFYIPMIFDYDFKFGREITFNTVVFDSAEGSPAKEAGIEPGEVILKVDGVEINSVSDLRQNLSGKSGLDVEIETLDIRDRSYTLVNEYTVVPEYFDPQNEGDGDAIIGVYLGEAVSLSYEKPLEKIFAGPLHSYNILSYSVSTLGKIIGISVETRDIEPVSSSVAGPVGIFNILGSILREGGRERPLLLIDNIALISLGFAFTNILPIPALDGGRIVFRFFEGITRKKVNPKLEANVHKLGMIGLLFLIVLITLKDIGA